MSEELENQIEEDLFKDKATHFFKKYRKLLILLLILFITVPSFYQIYKSYNLKKNSNLLTDYSKAMLILNGNEPNNAIHLFEKLIKNHDNEKIKTLALNRLIEIHLKNNNLKKINEIFNENILNKTSSKEFLDLIKIKKSLIIFDTATEEEMLLLLDKNNFFKNISLQILSDFYISRKMLNKYQKISNEIK